MVIATDLLKAKHIGIRDLKEHLSKRLKERLPLVITEHGEPVKFILSYQDVLELIDVLDELQDMETLQWIQEGRGAVKKGAKGFPVSDLFRHIRTSR
ncbi:MAG: hypothetical protein HY586_02025 [Candidatus Omnitrophica bacterium]|nr:hypothetical protein [Candidatus Omnitrophota bacterium]